MVCYFFCLTFVIMGVPGGPVCQGVFRGSSGSVPVVFRGCSGVLLACSWFHRQGRLDHYGFESSLRGNTG